MLFPGLSPETRLVFYDTETGGIEPRHPTIQVAASVWDANIETELDWFSVRLLFDPDLCQPEALDLNSYDEELWNDDALSPALGWGSFFEFLEKHRTKQLVSKQGNPYNVAVSGGHNVMAFDFPRVKNAAAKLGRFNPMWYYQLDSYPLAVAALHTGAIDAERLNLEALSDYFGLTTNDEFHDAVNDCRMAAQVCRKLVEALRNAR